ncbi:hypothetical protein GPA19_11525 [Azoarcus indigens]|uniref:Shikimate kinase n=1 Tax=Azoarcus indigens TaxID=29545 RepID=A0A4R6DXG3_9RHOO|nr:shikimate kinase [Azoarcus indigens]NMG65578.1 hypothetical protein [Azoarcus indigens]TDN50015.1 shikimate kinase [Azoarcus indigens]
MIQLTGPGGAGKSATGLALAQRLNTAFVDLDTEFIARNGDLSIFIASHGYDTYARQNVTSYRALLDDASSLQVMTLSSGFMTYREEVHPDYVVLRQQILASPLTFVLLPSLDQETCVAEVVRRQLQRPFARSPQREEEVIRVRFPVHAGLPTRKVLTDRPIAAVVDEIIGLLGRPSSA